jgi:hypothetical protein
MVDNNKLIFEKKKCTKCHILKDIYDFRIRKDRKCGYRSSCKECDKEMSKKWINKNLTYVQERNKNYNKKYYKSNLDNIKERHKSYYLNNAESCKEKMADFKKNNPNYNKDYNKERKLIDPIYKLNLIIRSRINKFFKLNKINKKNNTFDIVGCSPIFLKEHIENKFTEGMSWDNRGLFGWHIDHIIPLSSAKTEEEIYKLCHYTNLQPLWAEDNLKKSNKYYGR